MAKAITNQKPKEFYERMLEAAFQAEKAVGEVFEYTYRIGNDAISLRFYGEPLVSAITAPFHHLNVSTNHSSPELTIHLWESASTGVKMPPRPWGRDDTIARGEVRGFNDGNICVALSADVGAVSVCNIKENAAVFWIRSAEHLPLYERGAPLRWILHWWMRQHDKFLIHAGLVGLMGQGVLLVGKGGSGKSTTALSCLAEGWNYLADDYCLVQAVDPLLGYSVYSTAKLNHQHLQSFPELLRVDRSPFSSQEEKALLYLSSKYSANLCHHIPLKAILIPKIVEQVESKAVPATSSVALKALAPSSLFQLPSTGYSDFRALTEIVKRVPAYILQLGTAVRQIPRAVEEVIR